MSEKGQTISMEERERDLEERLDKIEEGLEQVRLIAKALTGLAEAAKLRKELALAFEKKRYALGRSFHQLEQEELQEAITELEALRDYLEQCLVANTHNWQQVGGAPKLVHGRGFEIFFKNGQHAGYLD